MSGCVRPSVCTDIAVACTCAGELCTAGGLQVAVVQGEPVSGKQVHIMAVVGACTHKYNALPEDGIRSAVCTRTLTGTSHVC